MIRIVQFTTLLCVAVSAISASACNFPPEYWCSSEEITRQCGVEKQCLSWRSNQRESEAPLVRYELYFESLCPGCRHLLTTQLYPAWQKVKEIVNVTLIPYGNAQEEKVGDQWKYTCQHGPQECVGNLIETCALSLLTFDTAFAFIYCLETNNPPTSGPECASKLGLTAVYPEIKHCSENSSGNALEHVMAQKTDALQPQHQYVPWVVLNGVHNDDIQNQAESDSLALICKTYTGPKPPACAQQIHKHCPRDRLHASPDSFL